MKLDIFESPGPFEGFCRYVGGNLGIRVVMLGKEIKASRKPLPTVYIPCLEHAREEDVKLLLGFSLHEAGHLWCTNYDVLDEVHDYYLFKVFNAFEDIRMERRLEKRLLGARDMLKYSMEQGYKLKFNDDGHQLVASETGAPILEEPPHFRMDSEEGVQFLIQQGGEVPDALGLKKMELFRLLVLWIRKQRRFDLSLADLPSHEWLPVLESVTSHPAHRTRDCLEQAQELLRRLGIPFDEGQGGEGTEHRPVNERDHEREEAAKEHQAARERFRRARQLTKEMNERLRQATKNLQQGEEYEAAREQSKETAANKSVASEAKKQAIGNRNHAVQKRKEASQDLKEAKRLLAEAKASGDKAMIRLREEGVRRARRALENAKAEVEEAKDVVERAKTSFERMKSEVEEAKEEARRLRDEMRQAKEEAERPVRDEMQPRIDGEQSAGMAHERRAMGHEYQESAIQNQMDRRDKVESSQVKAEAMRRVTDHQIEQFKGQAVGEEFESRKVDFNSNGTADDLVVGIPIPPARKYTPFTRAYDGVFEVNADLDANRKYEEAVRRNQPIIDEMLRRLKRLKSPVVTKQKFNVEEGRIDTRHLVRIALGLRGVPTDLERVYKTVNPRPKPKIAIQLLLDCSNSLELDGTWEPQLDAAVVVSEVLSALSIPFEVLGHTTSLDLPDHDLDDLQWASRIVPFRGLVFKSFPSNGSDKAKPAGAFSCFQKADNIDGEAVLWAASRLCERPERIKIMFCLSDGDPQAVESNCAELQRHLFMVVKTLEEHEPQGLVLHGVGIGTDRSKDYFNNSTTANKASIAKDVANAVATELEGRIGVA